MHGLAGIVRFDGAPLSADALRLVLATMTVGHVDRSQVEVTPSAAFGLLARHFLPEDRFDRQPLRSRDGRSLLVTTALLHNRAELAAELGRSPAEAAGLADSDLVLAAWEKWGEACVARLDGPFSLVVWQETGCRLFCAVDPLEVHPLYLGETRGQFALASTLRGILAAPGVSRELNESTLANFVGGVRSAPSATLYRDVSKLPGGHSLSVDRNGRHLRRHWNPRVPRVLHLPSDAAYVDAFRSELEAAVERSLTRRAGSAGILVSGGLDSSAITAVAGRQLAERGERLQAFHFVPAGDSRYQAPLRRLDESAFVDRLQAHAPHIDFHRLPPDLTVGGPAEWEDFFEVNQVPCPSLPGSPGPDRHLLAQAAPDLGLLLNGQGGNTFVSLEAFGSGYLAHLATSGHWLRWWREASGHARVYGWSLRKILRHAAINPLKHLLRGRAPAIVFKEANYRLLNPALRDRTGIAARVRQREDEQVRPVRDFREYLHGVLLEQKDQSIAPRMSHFQRQPALWLGAAPFSDPRLNEFCLSLPFEQQIRDGWDRRLLRESMRGLLPDEVRLRVTRGFPQPEFQARFTRAAPLLAAELERLGSSPLAREYLDLERLKTLWQTRAARPTIADEMTLVRTILVGAFLRWHEQRRA